MTYKLDGIDISIWGAVPYVDNAQECIAISGLFDLPKRKGTIEYNWGTSVEPFVDEDDIDLDGRTLTLKVCIKGSSSSDYLKKLNDYKLACISCRNLWTEFGEFGVVMKDVLDVEEYYEYCMAIVTTKFWQQDFILSKLLILPSGGSDSLLDGYSMTRDFGIYIASRKDDKSISKRIEVSTTSPYTQTLYREPRDITFTCTMIGDNLQNLYSKITQFQALCMGPGLRILKLSETESFDLYFKDGMVVKTTLETLLKFDLKCRVVI